MGLALDMTIRLQIVALVKEGNTLVRISEELGIKYGSVCRIYRLYKQEGLAGLKPKYTHCGNSSIQSSYKLYRSSLWLKRKHPQWGAPFILLLLKERYNTLETASFPSTRTLQRWFKEKGYTKPRQKKVNLVLENP